MRDNHSGSDRSSDLEEKKNSPEFFDLRQVIRMSKVFRLETEEEPGRFFDLEDEKTAGYSKII